MFSSEEPVLSFNHLRRFWRCRLSFRKLFDRILKRGSKSVPFFFVATKKHISMLATSLLKIESISEFLSHELDSIRLSSRNVGDSRSVQVFHPAYFPVRSFRAETRIYKVRRLIDVPNVSFFDVRETHDHKRTRKHSKRSTYYRACHVRHVVAAKTVQFDDVIFPRIAADPAT